MVCTLSNQQSINMPRLLTSLLLKVSVIMPQRVVCQQCGYVLHEGPELKPPDEILHQHNGKCPRCGKKLSLIPINVEVKPIK
jgi:ribosomal protein S27AE